MRRIELLAEIIVFSVTGLAFLACFVLCVTAHFSVWFVPVFGYFLAIWCVPGVAFFEGLSQRKGKDLLYWIAITFSHEVLLLVWSFSQVMSHFSSRRRMEDTREFYIACFMISLIPVLVIIILVPSYVYITLERSSSDAELHGDTLREYRNLQETTRQRNPNTRDDRMAVIKRKLWHRIVGLTPRLRRFTGTRVPVRENPENTEPRADVTENPAFNREEDLSETATDLLPPSYSQVLDEGLPDYRQVVTRNVRLGQKVFIVDKKMKISTFKTHN